MQTFRAIAAGMAAVAFWAAAASGFPRQTTGGEDPLQHFQSAVDAYMALHEAVGRTTPPRQITPDAEILRMTVDALAAGIRAARPSAKEGDIIDAPAAVVFRQRIRDTLRDRSCDLAEIAAAESDDEARPLARALVHDRFDWARGSYMPGCVLNVLPVLPGQLQFRFVDRDLVIVDIDASLVVDVVPDVLPAIDSWEIFRADGESFARPHSIEGMTIRFARESARHGRCSSTAL
jgi:hypothetical protein